MVTDKCRLFARDVQVATKGPFFDFGDVTEEVDRGSDEGLPRCRLVQDNQLVVLVVEYLGLCR